MAQNGEKTAAQVEAEQEAILAKKYGGMKPKKRLIPKEQKFFDSADWQLQKQGVKNATTDPPPTPTAGPLAPRLAPKVDHAAPSRSRRRASHLGDFDNEQLPSQ
ncbi:hypothetical protein WJX73_009606 [Symbiochloris irregularis]|uniref:Negatively light-regulated protein n=1 Tax=Symbiochloris irregularis TaxID=706552 RepID=A0AAW1Q0P5_9CHLO